MTDKSKHPKIGDKVKIVANYHNHCFKRGEEVYIFQDCSKESFPNWGATRNKDLSRSAAGCYVYIEEFEIVPKVEETNIKPINLVFNFDMEEYSKDFQKWSLSKISNLVEEFNDEVNISNYLKVVDNGRNS